MTKSALNRRDFLTTSAAAAAAGLSGPAAFAKQAGGLDPNNLRFAGIGVGIRGRGLIREASSFAACEAICDVDAAQARRAQDALAKMYADKRVRLPRPALNEDYRRVLDRKDIDVVVVATPDHWHTKIAVEALHAGKAVYCEKPLTLTIDEGAQIERALEQTGGVLAVGAQQRSQNHFQNAAALVRAGRLGKIKRVTCSLGGAPRSNVLPVVAPPSELNWNRWLGPAKYVPYREAASRPSGGYGSQFPHGRGHAHFRWWYEYSGGKLTDWGAHHVDIAMWALEKSTAEMGRFRIEPIVAEHPVDFVDGMPVADDQFNTATQFKVRVTFADGVEIDIRHSANEDLGFGNGIMFEGESGRILVNRSKLVGKPAEELKENPVAEEVYKSLHPSANPKGGWHMQNFFDSVLGKTTPITDVATHHRHLTVCHAANLALRLGRPLEFDPLSQRFVDDPVADSLLRTEPRAGFETEA